MTKSLIVWKLVASVTDAGNPREKLIIAVGISKSFRAKWRKLSAHSKGRYYMVPSRTSFLEREKEEKAPLL